ncbi:hypothetical protein, partial [uncultured Microscilla sp.]|uniref:hypothetical protein n=1 Tax=uncultured Microscilla sp. TaxID=432653 RepID=UPI002610EA95
MKRSRKTEAAALLRRARIFEKKIKVYEKYKKISILRKDISREYTSTLSFQHLTDDSLAEVS